MSPLPETNQAIYSSKLEAYTMFCTRPLGDSDNLLLASPDAFQTQEARTDLGIDIIPVNSVGSDQSAHNIVESYYVCHHIGKKDEIVRNAVVVYRSKVPGVYVQLRYSPETYDESRQPIFTNDPEDFDGGRCVKLGVNSEKEYLQSIDGCMPLYRIGNLLGALAKRSR